MIFFSAENGCCVLLSSRKYGTAITASVSKFSRLQDIIGNTNRQQLNLYLDVVSDSRPNDGTNICIYYYYFS